MRWSIDPQGFEVIFDRAIPPFAGAHMAPAVAGIVDRAGVGLADRPVCVPSGRHNADSDEGGHLLRFDRGHHSNLMAASLASSRGPVLVMSRRRSRGQAVAHGLS
jgi:hypothetical protein